MTAADQELLERWLDGDADPAVVNELLERDPAAVTWLAQRAELHAALRQSLQRRRLQQVTAARLARAAKVRRWPFRMAWAAAACVVAGGAFYFLRQPVKLSEQGVAVQVLEAENAGAEWTAGASRSVGALVLTSGRLKLQLDSGVTVNVEAPADLTFDSSMALRLASGKVTADVGARGKGFTITTPQTRVVDLGTVFGVQTGTAEATDVVVLSGRVELHDGPQPELVEEGQAVRVSRERGHERIQNVVLSRRRGEWSTQPPPADCAFRSVSDRMERAAEPFSYHITPGGLVEGVPAFVNQPQVLADIPASLVGADLVQTFRGSRKNARFSLEVTLARRSALYVLCHQAETPPAWLAEKFQRTGETLALSNAPNGGRRSLPYEVWRRAMPEGGTITLGSARDSPDGRVMMYVLAARPLD